MDSVRVSRRLFVVVWLLLAPLVAVVGVADAAAVDGCTGLGCKGIDIANRAIEVHGSAYVLGQPPRNVGSVGTVPAQADCSGLVWWAAAMEGVDMPGTSQAQYTYGGNIEGAPWTTELPRGTLLFLHDDNPALGGGATHVSIYIGGGEAMDCYNETFGCAVHDVVNDGYYRDHWLGATYPWGDKPDGAVSAGPSTGSGIGSGEIPNIIQSPGVTYKEFEPRVNGIGNVATAPLDQASTETAVIDGAALVDDRLGGLAEIVGYGKALDFFLPLKLSLAFGLMLLVLLIKVGLSTVRWLRGGAV